MPLVRAKSVEAEPFSRKSRAGVRIVHLAALQNFREEYFEPDWWLAGGKAHPVGAGRGANWFVDGGAGKWVLRHYRRGGLVARLFGDRYLWTGYSRSRSCREFQLLRELRAAGLPVPRAIAARVVRRGPVYRADLITELLPDTTTLAARIAQDSASDADLDATGRCIRQMHEMGVWHADLNAHNVLVDAAGGVFLIDFDRARRRAGESWKKANLARLRRSLDKVTVAADAFDERRWQILVDAYGRAS